MKETKNAVEGKPIKFQKKKKKLARLKTQKGSLGKSKKKKGKKKEDKKLTRLKTRKGNLGKN